MNLIDRWRKMHGRMSRADERRWAQPQTHEELGAVMADWLLGNIASQPGYMPYYGPDDETQELLPILVALNYHGFVTDGSQPGVAPEIGYNDEWWRQRAAVEGWCDEETMARLRAIVESEPDLRFVAHQVKIGVWERLCRFVRADGEAVVVTQVNRWETPQEETWTPVTTFGATRTTGDLDDDWAEVNLRMYGALRTGWYVAIVDLRWGENRLWPLLASYFSGAGEQIVVPALEAQ